MVPFFDLSRQYKKIKPEIDPAVKKVLSRGVFSLGAEVAAFETEFAGYIGVKYAVGVASGTDALTMSVRALGLTADDEVILPANSYPSVFGVALSGVKIRLVDCDENGLINVNKLDQVITSNTKAIVPVHLYGQAVDLTAIKIILSSYKHKIYLVEDAAQAHGAAVQIPIAKNQIPNKNQYSNSNKKISVNWQKVGGIGDVGIFSFYPTKNLGAYGDGGMVVAGDLKIYQVLKQLRQYGEADRYRSLRVSGVSRLDELQAAILRVKLKHLDEWNRRRSDLADYYERELEGVGDIRFLNQESGIRNQGNSNDGQNQNSQFIIHDSKSCNHLFVIRTKYRDELKAYLAKKGIGTAIHYPVPIHLVWAFKHLGYSRGDFPVAESLADQILSLPLFAELKLQEQTEAVRQIKSFFTTVSG